jgi:branched-chain amino acid transport system permease protein
MSEIDFVISDRNELAHRIWYRRIREKIQPLLTKKIIAEHKRDPLGNHSDALKRVLNLVRRSAPNGKYLLMCTRPFREWRIVRSSGVRGQGPTPVDERSFNSEAKAMHALFLMRIEELNRK